MSSVEIKIIGWGEEEKYKEEVKLKGLKNVEFLGSFFGKAKLPYFSAADAFILPSSKEVLQRIQLCRGELAELKRLLRAVRALEDANEKRTSRAIAQTGGTERER